RRRGARCRGRSGRDAISVLTTERRRRGCPTGPASDTLGHSAVDETEHALEPSAPLPDEIRLRLPEHVLTRTVGDETVLLDLESEEYYGLDGVGARFAELIGG